MRGSPPSSKYENITQEAPPLPVPYARGLVLRIDRRGVRRAALAQSFRDACDSPAIFPVLIERLGKLVRILPLAKRPAMVTSGGGMDFQSMPARSFFGTHWA